MSGNMISTNEMRLRLIDLEYKDLTEQECESKVNIWKSMGLLKGLKI